MRASVLLAATTALVTSACHQAPPTSEPSTPAAALPTRVLEETVITATLDAAGIAEAVRQATLSTTLMGTVVGIEVNEGDMVEKGRVLARVDAADLSAKAAQVEAGLADARAMYAEADRQLARMRKLNDDKAAPRAMLDAAQTGHARAEAAIAAARAQQAELDAARRYADIRAPFAGQIVKRFVDPGAFAAPGSPLLTIQDTSSLRASAAVSPSVARDLVRGASIAVGIEGVEARGVIEGVVPSPHGSLHTVNVIVDNAAGRHLAGSAVTLHLPMGERPALLVPTRELVREGDLVGVRVRGASGPELRWVRVGGEVGDATEVLSGLRAGDVLVIAKADGR